MSDSKKSSASPIECAMRSYASRSSRVPHEAEVPVFRVMQIGEAAVDQRTHEVERQRRALVAAQQQLRIGAPRLRRKFGPIDQVAAIGRQASRRRAFPCRPSAAWRTGRPCGRRGSPASSCPRAAPGSSAAAPSAAWRCGRTRTRRSSRRSPRPAAGNPRRAARLPAARAGSRLPTTLRSGGRRASSATTRASASGSS